MGIQIRPAAVSAQLDRKRELLDGMRDQIAQRQAAVRDLQGEEGLAGAGFEAACERFGTHALVLSAISYYLDLVQAADGVVQGALEIFGGEAVVDEQTYLDLQAEALRNMAAVQDVMDDTRSKMEAGVPFMDNALATIGFSLQVFEEQSAQADEMLGKIYSYCNQTNGAYSSAAQQNIMAACSSVCVAMNASATPASWGNQDYAGMAAGIKQAAATPVKTVKDLYYSAEDVYRNREMLGLSGDKMGPLHMRMGIPGSDTWYLINEGNVHMLMGKPFELWTDEEISACSLAYNEMSVNKDNASIEKFIGASYYYSDTQVFSYDSPNVGGGGVHRKDEWVLGQGFAGFAEAYAYVASAAPLTAQVGSGGGGKDLEWENAAYAGVLWDVACNASHVYTSFGAAQPVGVVRLEGKGMQSVATYSYSQANLRERDIEIKASGNLLYYSSEQVENAFVNLKVDAGGNALGSMQRTVLIDSITEVAKALGKEVPGLGLAISSVDAAVAYGKDMETNAIAEQGITWNDFNNAADGADFNGIVCDSNGTVSFLGHFDEKSLQDDVEKYNIHAGCNQRITIEDVKDSIRTNGLDGAIDYSGTNDNDDDNERFTNVSIFLDKSRGEY